MYLFPSRKQHVFAFLNEDAKEKLNYLPGDEKDELTSSRVLFVISKPLAPIGAGLFKVPLS